MARGLTYSEAQSKLLDYAEEINRVKKLMQRNFEDMDFENSNRREKVEEYVEEIKNKCEVAITEMESVHFE